jgi:hypothetical protein
MKKIKSLLLLFIIFVLISCESNGVKKVHENGVLVIKNPEHGLLQNYSVSPLKFELEQTYGKENEPIEELFSRITDVFSDEDRNVYILDTKDNRILCFDVNGRFIWSNDKKGEGPGEFKRARGMVFDGQNTFYLCSSSGSQIDKFNINGEYQDRFYLSNLDIGRVFLHGFIDPNILVTSRTETGKSGIYLFLLEMGESLRVKTKIEIFEDIGIKLTKGFSTKMEVSVSGGEVRVANVDRYEFRFYNIEGKVIKKITRDFNKIVRPGLWITDSWASIIFFSYLSAPTKLFDGYEISFSYWPTNVSNPDEYVLLNHNKKAPKRKYMNMFDLFNNDGELLYSIYEDNVTPKMGKPIHVDSYGKLYTLIYEPFPQVRRYNLNINID